MDFRANTSLSRSFFRKKWRHVYILHTRVSFSQKSKKKYFLEVVSITNTLTRTNIHVFKVQTCGQIVEISHKHKRFSSLRSVASASYSLWIEKDGTRISCPEFYVNACPAPIYKRERSTKSNKPHSRLHFLRNNIQ